MVVGLVAGLSGCGLLPRSGPSTNEILSGSVEADGNAFVVPVSDHVARTTRAQPISGFPSGFLNLPVIPADAIRAGDTLALTIFENVDTSLLANPGANTATLDRIQVDSDGFVFIPYVGRLRAAGKSPEQLRRLITERLDLQTPDPQILVHRAGGDGATVSVVGGVGAQGVYPIERPNQKLSAMLATSGGLTIPLQIARITVIRGRDKGAVWLQDLYEHPQLDIALRNGDRILVEEDRRSFLALGATLSQREVPFDKPELSALDAVARVGGLSSTLADPKAMFVLREEPERVARSVLRRSDLTGPQRMIYALDLTQPAAMFLARDFSIHDGDVVYVSEAPYVSFMKVLSAFNSTISPINNAQSLGQ